jgi:iron complex outermembrane receptor protein
VSDLIVPGLSLDATVFNALDRRYEQGGTVLHPYPQPGRWFLLTLGYRFSPAL